MFLKKSWISLLEKYKSKLDHSNVDLDDLLLAAFTVIPILEMVL